MAGEGRATRMSKGNRGRRILMVLGVLLLAPSCGNGTPPTVPGAELPIVWIRVGGHRVSAEIAERPLDRQRGLMFRESLPADHGMLFVFPSDAVQGFWMRNTTLPLSIAFAEAGGRIVRIADLEPLDERPVTSLGPVRYALEMNRGWFEKHGVVAGDAITEIPGARAR
jgi:uncharacterized protein